MTINFAAMDVSVDTPKRKSPRTSPTQRTLKTVRAMGYAAAVVERWNKWAMKRQDLFGMDVLALKAGEPVLVIQTTTGAHHADRKSKILDEYLPLWEGAGVRVELWTWAKQGARGKAKRWTLRREVLCMGGQSC